MNWIYFFARPAWQRYKLRNYQGHVIQANGLEPAIRELSDQDLQSRLSELRGRAQSDAKLNKYIPEALALGRETSRRRLGMRHYDVQLLGTLALYEGHIAEMDTGEGKTLMAPLAAYLHHLTHLDNCTHIVTANEYLAERDMHWMKLLYQGLGLSVGLIVPGQSNSVRAKAYHNDVVYATAKEIVFDALRRPMRKKQTSTVDAILRPDADTNIEPKYDFAIVDEVDSVLLDQAQNPLSIGGAASVSPQIEVYKQAHLVAGQLVRGTHYRLMQDDRSIELKDEGKSEATRNVGPVVRQIPSGHRWERYVTCALAARYIYKKDQHYVLRDNQIVLVDESTGRMMPGRQLPDGIHQAIEVMNGLNPSAELRGNMATTFQSYFRKYNKLAGMTGSASIADREFLSVYDLATVPIPPHRPRKRRLHPEKIYRNHRHKYAAILGEIKEIHATGRPILVGTGSVLASEQLSQHLQAHGLDHDVLNAKNHAREAEIIAQAGQEGRITIITNMAGRGVDILLGEGIADKGGMHLIGTDRSVLRRLDEQLMGRIGRQGDPGECRFFLSLRDELFQNVDRKKKCRVRLRTRGTGKNALKKDGVLRLFNYVQRHNDKIMRKQRNNLCRGEKHREKLREQGLWEDWMDAR